MKYWILAFALFLTVLLRFPSLFEPYWYGDEGVTLTVGQVISRGGILYRDIDDNKPPLLYFLSALSHGDLFGFKLLTLFWSLLTVFIFYFLASSFLGKRFGFISTLIFILLTNTPILEGNIVNSEIYLILPTTLAGFLIWKSSAFKNTSMNKIILLAGIIFSCGFLFKVPAITDFIGITFFLILSAPKIVSKNFIKRFSFLLAGFSIPLILITLYFVFHHAFFNFIQSVFLNNFIYSQTWGPRFIAPKQYLWLKTFVLISLILFFFLRRKKIEKDHLFLSLWFFFSLFGVLLSARPYKHYLLQIVPVFSLLSGLLLKKRAVGLVIPLIFLLTVVWYQFEGISGNFFYSYQYYKNFLTFIRGEKSHEWYAQTFDPQVSQTSALSDFLKTNTSLSEKVFIWSDNSLIYPLSKRLPVGRFITAYYIEGLPYAKNETIKSLTAEKPRFIIITLPQKGFNDLEEIIKKDYYFKEELKGAKIYER